MSGGSFGAPCKTPDTIRKVLCRCAVWGREGVCRFHQLFEGSLTSERARSFQEPCWIRLSGHTCSPWHAVGVLLLNNRHPLGVAFPVFVLAFAFSISPNAHDTVSSVCFILFL